MNLKRLTVTARVPLIVTLFMIAVSSFASERVLSRLIDTQTRQVESLADTYLDGLALALVDSIIREDVWQVFDVLDRSRHRPGEIQPVETVVAGADGFVIASSNPIAVPSQGLLVAERRRSAEAPHPAGADLDRWCHPSSRHGARHLAHHTVGENEALWPGRLRRVRARFRFPNMMVPVFGKPNHRGHALRRNAKRDQRSEASFQLARLLPCPKRGREPSDTWEEANEGMRQAC